MIDATILDAIGETPLVRLNRLADEKSAEILVKFEAVNVGGSIKTRTAYRMIVEAERQGLLGAGSVIVEPTSGNQGIGLALIGAVRGYRTVIIMPDSVSEERRKLIQNYGAKLRLVHDEGDIGACIRACIALALQMKREDPRVFVPQQFENPANVLAHYETTGAEIVRQAERRIDGFCCGIGTGGTITGVGRRLREANPDTVIWAVEPENGAALSGGPVGSHVQMGIGDGVIPAILDTAIYDRVVTVTDEEALATARQLAAQEGLMCGISSGTNVAAARRLARKLGAGKTVVTILPDTGERYFSTELF